MSFNDGNVDPLDAFMAGLEAEASKTIAPMALSQIGTKRRMPAEVSSDIEMEEDDAEKAEDDLNFKNVEELIAYANKKAKRKDLVPVDHDQIVYPWFRKNFYLESPEISRISEEEVRQLRFELDMIKIRGAGCPRPIRKWTHCGLSPKILEVIKKHGYEKPTPIQAQAIPAIMAGRDVIGVAKTGSGKTIAFLLPMLRHVLDQPPLATMDGPIALVMAPTRELAMQTYIECRKFTLALSLRVVCAYGGAPIKDQIADLKRGAEIIICTPGRYLDLLIANSGKVTNLRRVTFLVLDEADRMFDMGFGPQVLKIVANIRPDKQAVLFSATFPKQMEALARKALVKPLEITVGARSVVCDDVTQIVEVISDDDRFPRLLAILGDWCGTKANRVLIFVDRQDSADTLMKDLLRRGYICMTLHGGKDQADRDSAIVDFKSGDIPILIATSVAARGLDVKELNLVINYDCPNHMEDYVHRVGRTGRAGNKGTAFTFVTPDQDRYAPDILRALKASKAEIPAALQKMGDEFMERVKAGDAETARGGFGGKGLERIDKGHEQRRRTEQISYAGDEHVSEQDEEDLDFEGGIVTKKTAVDSPVLPVPSKPREARKAGGKVGDETIAMNKAQELARMIAERVSKTGAVPEISAMDQINSRYRAVVGKEGIAGEIFAIMEVVPGAGGSRPKFFACEIEINDYPQNARHRITYRETINQIIDRVGVTMLVRGVYVAPGKVPPEGERKLFLRIEGDTEIAVEKARTEVKHILLEATMEAAERGAIKTS